MQDENEYQEGLTPAEREVASALGSLRPATTGIDRDRLMFRAGRASMRRAGRLWQTAAALLAVGLCLSIAFRQPASKMPRVAHLPTPSSEATRLVMTRQLSTMVVPDQDSYIRMRGAVLEKGLDALPQSTAAGNADEPTMLARLLNMPAEPPAQPGGWLDLLGM